MKNKIRIFLKIAIIENHELIPDKVIFVLFKLLKLKHI